MTVSDWGSAQAPYGASGYGAAGSGGRGYPAPGLVQDRSQSINGPVNAQVYHPAHGGPAPRMPVAEEARDPYARSPGAPMGDGHGAPRQADGDGVDRSAGVFSILGALLSVLLVLGLGVWGYKLAVRDVTGVPVVKALEGPMRLQPEEPGGAVAPHQGLAVNEVAGEATGPEPVDQVVLAPPAAVLADEDIPARTGAEVTSADQRPAVQPLPLTGGDINADAAVAEALGLTAVPGVDDASFDGASAPIEVIPESIPGVTVSPRPEPRPEPRPAVLSGLPELEGGVNAIDVAATAATAATADPAVVLGREIAPGEIDPSARLVQLGAYPSAEAARDGWTSIANLNPDLFNNRNWTIEQHSAGGAPFYRLRAIGFDGLDDARAFCAALIAAQGSCVPVID